MKLYNRTKLDDDLLEKVLYDAAKKTKIGVRAGNVVVKVTSSSSYLSGCVWSASGVSKQWLEGRKSSWSGVFIKTDGAYMVLRIPVFGRCQTEEVVLVESLFRTAAHEWKHVADYQKGKLFAHHKLGRSRRINWADRPQEKRAMAAATRAGKIMGERSDIQEALLELAINIERLRKVKIIL